MPAAILSKANPPEPRPVEITAIAPDKTHLTVSKFYFNLFIYLPLKMRALASVQKVATEFIKSQIDRLYFSQIPPVYWLYD